MPFCNQHLIDMAGTVDHWELGLSTWDPSWVQGFESILSIGNGRIGQRANFEEAYSGGSLQGSYLAGVYYPDKTKVGWWKNGYPEYFAKVLNSTNWIGIDVKVDGEPLDLAKAESVDQFVWGLNMQDGILKRGFSCTMQNGAAVQVVAERFCSMHNPELGCLRYRVEAGGHLVEVMPYLDAGVTNADSNWNDAFWSIHEVTHQGPGKAYVRAETNKTHFGAAFAMNALAHVTDSLGQRELAHTHLDSDASRVGIGFQAQLSSGESLTLEKYVGICTTLQHEAQELVGAALAHSDAAAASGWNSLVESHQKAWARIWSQADIEITGDVASQQAIRFNIFHLNQTYRGDDARLNIGPKGFTGEKYGGASYWDTEAYCIPFYLAGHPEHVARQLLVYRFNHLEKAIENAEKLGFSDGAALYPMVTMNGEECHNEWEITFEEIHRNGAMSYAIWNYVNYTGDQDYLRTHGFAVLLGVARFWQQRVQWSADKNAYVILGVTGPNEYENNVNNNWYTNYLAAWCMRYALEVAQWLKSEHPSDWSRLTSEYTISEAPTFEAWSQIPDQMYLPQLEGTEVRLQQDGFMDKEQLSVDDLSEEQRPINQKWSWDRILRSIFIKQADVLQGLYFFWDDFSLETHRVNYKFYEPKTVHESSLSPCVHSIIASRLDRMDDAYKHYLRTSRLDLDDYNKEVHEGLHITSMAGTWLSVVEGFGGFDVRDGMPRFRGKLPTAWKGLRFKINFRNRLLDVVVSEEGTSVALIAGQPIDVEVNGQVKRLDAQGH